MIILKRTTSEDEDFIKLVALLDEYLHGKDGNEHSFYAQFNKLGKIKNVIVAYDEETPVGCGAFKAYNPDTAEIKRMFVQPDVRGKGIATAVLTELENWAQELNFSKCILETGKRQIEAVAFYKKNNYKVVHNFGQYMGVENSICFEKLL